MALGHVETDNTTERLVEGAEVDEVKMYDRGRARKGAFILGVGLAALTVAGAAVGTLAFQRVGEGKFAEGMRALSQADIDAGFTCTTPIVPYNYVEQDKWGTQYNGWEMCSGIHQTPINLRYNVERVKGAPQVERHFGQTGSLMEWNDGRVVEMQVAPGAAGFGTVRVTYNGQTETLDAFRFHFHTPSEHSVEGRRAAAEIHIASKKDGVPFINGLGILFDIGEHNACLATYIDALPRAGCENKQMPGINLETCFGHQLSGPYWTYEGSRSKPPCQEDSRWIVLERRSTLSKEQLNKLHERYKSNTRKTQSREHIAVKYMRPAC